MENLQSIQKILNYLEDNSDFKNSNDLESLFLDYEKLIDDQRGIESFIQLDFAAYYLNSLKDMKYIRFLQLNTYFFYFVFNLTKIINKK